MEGVGGGVRSTLNNEHIQHAWNTLMAWNIFISVENISKRSVIKTLNHLRHHTTGQSHTWGVRAAASWSTSRLAGHYPHPFFFSSFMLVVATGDPKISKNSTSVTSSSFWWYDWYQYYHNLSKSTKPGCLSRTTGYSECLGIWQISVRLPSRLSSVRWWAEYPALKEALIEQFVN